MKPVGEWTHRLVRYNCVSLGRWDPFRGCIERITMISPGTSLAKRTFLERTSSELNTYMHCSQMENSQYFGRRDRRRSKALLSSGRTWITNKTKLSLHSDKMVWQRLETGKRMYLSIVSPWPNWPLVPRPQLYTLPLSVMATVCLHPHVTCVTFCNINPVNVPTLWIIDWKHLLVNEVPGCRC